MRLRFKRKTLFGFSEISGLVQNFRTGFESCGEPTTFACLAKHKFNYNRERHGLSDRFWTGILKRYSLWSQKTKLSKVSYFVGELIFFGISIFHGRIIILYGRFKEYFPAFRNLPKALQLLSVDVIFYMVGSDSRAPSFSRSGFETECGRPILAHELIDKTQTVYEKLLWISKQKSLVFDHPLVNQLHLKPYVNIFKVPIPPPLINFSPKHSHAREALPIVLHGPSKPAFKGTKYIRAAVNQLLAEGLKFEYREVTGVTHEVMLQEISKSSIVIDQLFSDTPSAMFAAECLALGRTCVVSGENWKILEDAKVIDEWPDTTLCDSKNLRECLIELIRTPPEKHQNITTRGNSSNSAREFLKILNMSNEERAILLTDIETSAVYYGCGVSTVDLLELLLTLQITAPLMPEIYGYMNRSSAVNSLINDVKMKIQTDLPNDSPQIVSLIERNIELQKEMLEMNSKIEKMEKKLENFRGMIKRRDLKIKKLSK